MTVITKAAEVIQHIKEGWELWHVSRDALPGRWEMRRGRDTVQVHWDAIISVRRHHLPWLDQNTIETQEGKYTWSYVPKQRQLSGSLFPAAQPKGDQHA